MLLSLTTLAQVSIWPSMKARAAAGLPVLMSMHCAASLSRTSGFFSSASISLFIRRTISGGVRDGASAALQFGASKPA